MAMEVKKPTSPLMSTVSMLHTSAILTNGDFASTSDGTATIIVESTIIRKKIIDRYLTPSTDFLIDFKLPLFLVI
jgi:hypothetical protein